jgi:hypothetical protein
MRYSPGMEKLAVDSLRTLARAQGLELTVTELASLLPSSRRGRSGLATVRDIPPHVEPSLQFRQF